MVVLEVLVDQVAAAVTLLLLAVRVHLVKGLQEERRKVLHRCIVAVAAAAQVLLGLMERHLTAAMAELVLLVQLVVLL